MKLHEVQDGLMIEEYSGFHVVVILPFVKHHHRDEIDKPNDSHLVLVYLSSLDGDELVTDVLSDVKFAVGFKNMSDHHVILSSK